MTSEDSAKNTDREFWVWNWLMIMIGMSVQWIGRYPNSILEVLSIPVGSGMICIITFTIVSIIERVNDAR